jgi:hypothetical protein
VAVSVLEGSFLIQRIMRSVLVLVDQELPGCLMYILQANEQVAVQNFVPIGSIEALNVGVLVRLSRLGVAQRHPVVFRLLHEDLAQKLRAIVGQ